MLYEVITITFKENCPDVRNTKVVDIIHELNDFGTTTWTFDPWANKDEVKHEYGVDIFNDIKEIPVKKFDAIILAVAHNEFLALDYDAIRRHDSVIYDIIV